MIRLDATTFDSILKMLNSPIEEDIVVGLSCIERVDIRDNLAFILLLIKKSNVSQALWNEHAPLTTTTLKGVNIDVSQRPNYKDIMRVCLEYKVPPEQLTFFFYKLGEYFTNAIDASGYELRTEVSINLKFKTDESKSRPARKSE